MILARVIAGIAGALIGSAVFATPQAVILKADYSAPTTRYDHGILGDAVEWGALKLRVDFCAGCATRDVRNLVLKLPENRVFEDIAPRLVDVDGDGNPEVIVVETDLAKGARLAIYDMGGLRAATPFIGRTHRWLAPIGAADLDGDGFVEIAYIDRPHLARILRVWRFKNNDLALVAEKSGLTNHNIGDDVISGGLRDCEGVPEMITTDAHWQNIMATRLVRGVLETRVLGPLKGRNSFAKAMSCAF